MNAATSTRTPGRELAAYSSPISLLLSPLEGVRQTHPDRWLARCPAHEDTSPSLSIREADSGAVLLHCFGGCSAAAVVDAVGLELSDLYPPRADRHHRGPVPRQQRPYLTVRELIAVMRPAITVAWFACEDIAAGRPLSPEDLASVRDAAATLHRVMEAAS